MMNNLKKYCAKAIRVITTAPIFAALLCTLLYVLVPNSFASPLHFVLALGYLSVLPVLAYPISAIIPALRRKGRDGQRNLAIALSIVGYLGGFLTGLLSAARRRNASSSARISAPARCWRSARSFISRPAATRAAAPVLNAMLSLFISPWFMLGYLLLTPIYWSSKKLGRHSIRSSSSARLFRFWRCSPTTRCSFDEFVYTK